MRSAEITTEGWHAATGSPFTTTSRKGKDMPFIGSTIMYLEPMSDLFSVENVSFFPSKSFKSLQKRAV